MSTTILDILADLGYTNIKESSGFYRMRPIYRNSDNDTVLSVEKKTGRWRDFSANIGGSIQELIKLSKGLKDLNETNQWVENKFGTKILDDLVISNEQELEQPKVFDLKILKEFVSNHSYWTNRKIPKELLELFEGGVSVSGKMKNRYCFPIFDENGDIIGISGRYIGFKPNLIKWKHLGKTKFWLYPDCSKKEVVARQEAIIVESIGDMLSLYTCGIRNVLVSFGLKINNPTTSFLLQSSPKKIILAFNNDYHKQVNTGEEAAKKCRNKLLRYFDDSSIDIKLPDSDFNEMLTRNGPERILEWKKSN